MHFWQVLNKEINKLWVRFLENFSSQEKFLKKQSTKKLSKFNSQSSSENNQTGRTFPVILQSKVFLENLWESDLPTILAFKRIYKEEVNQNITSLWNFYT